PEGQAKSLFREETPEHFDIFGGTGWYRNVLAAAGSCLAFTKATWQRVGGFSAGESGLRADIQFCLRATLGNAGRLMLNPYARFRVRDISLFEKEAQADWRYPQVQVAFPQGDPFFHRHLEIDEAGRLRLARTRQPALSVDARAADNETAIEYFDFSQDEIKASSERMRVSPARELRSMAWFLPQFEDPYARDLMQVLSIADHALRVYNIAQTFVLLGGSEVSVFSTHLETAFPELARVADVMTLSRPDAVLDLHVDAAIATRWTTTLPLLRLRNAHRKLYFIQEWEPTLYHSSTTRAMVKATYRFGFHAFVTAQPLAHAYRFHGGTANYSPPMVDGQIFHAQRRVLSEQGNAPVVIMCDAHPKHRHHGFDVLMDALRELKEFYGEHIDIVATGAAWIPAQHGLAGVLRHAGPLAYAETGAFYRAVDIGVAALTNRHSLSFVRELMACGALVATHHTPYLSDLITPGENGVAFEMVHEDIISVLRKAIEHAEVRRAMSAATAQSVATRYTNRESACDLAVRAFSQLF
ncbi:MAG: glycosyltransferase family protein, partial [Janthinobacterium lividum]